MRSREGGGAIENRIMPKRLRANDGLMVEVGTTDMRIFIMLNNPPPKYKNTKKISKVALIKKYEMSYWLNFKYI